MGMYDSVYVDCPNCGIELEFQSKTGECLLREYEISEVPTKIALELDGETITCYNCNKTSKLKIKKKVKVMKIKVI